MFKRKASMECVFCGRTREVDAREATGKVRCVCGRIMARRQKGVITR